VKLPKGVEDGMQIRLAGKGDQGPGGAGDAIITIAIRPTPSSAAMATHSLDLPIAGRGGERRHRCGAHRGRRGDADRGAGQTSGKTLRLKGKGFTRKDGTRGDQLVRLEIALPDPPARKAPIWPAAGRLARRDRRAQFG
jgi:DnaJ-class molecular chaperone